MILVLLSNSFKFKNSLVRSINLQKGNSTHIQSLVAFRMKIEILLEKMNSIFEITFRDEDSVLWAHRNKDTETYYQSPSSSRPGLPIPSDPMARISHRARKQLEIDHGLTLL